MTGVRSASRALLRRIAASTVLATGAAAPTFGQPPSAAPPPETAGTAPAGDEIIITARRRDEPLAKAAVPVSVISAKELIETGASQVDRLNERFPALTVQPTATGNLIFIRGVGNFTLTPNSEPAIGFAYDGVFVARPTSTASIFFDLDRVELLKGPQGVLYGRNASAGSINLEPRQPLLGRTDAHIHVNAGSYEQRQVEAAINLPLRDGAAMRLSGAISDQEHLLSGYRDGIDQLSSRAQLKAAFGERVTVRLSADYNWLGGIGVGTSYIGHYLYQPAAGRYTFVPSGLARSQGIYSPEGQAYRQTIPAGTAGRSLDAIGSRPDQGHRFYGAHARIEARLGFADFVLIPARRWASLDSIVSGAPFGYRLREHDDQTSTEARLSGRAGAVDWLVGAFMFNEGVDNFQATNLSSALTLTRQSFETRSRALFANGTFHLSPYLRLGAGARWTRDRKQFEGQAESLTIICLARMNGRPSCPTVPLLTLTTDLSLQPLPVPDAPGTRLPILAGGVSTGAVIARGRTVGEGRSVDQALTWRVSAEADLAPGSLLYATVETGYRPGGFNIAKGFETYSPERITALTLGLRQRALAGKLELDAEAFWWHYRDQQVSSLRPDLSTPPRNTNITDNIAHSRIRGVELGARFRPASRTSLGAVLHFLHAEYRSFEYLQANIGAPPLVGCPATLTGTGSLYAVDCSGMQPYNSPRWSGTLTGRHSIPIKGFTVTVMADTHFRSARNIGFAYLPEQRVGPNWTTNAQLILGAPGERLEFAGFVRNIEGTRIPQFMNYHPLANALVAVTSPPRQWGFRASWRL